MPMQRKSIFAWMLLLAASAMGGIPGLFVVQEGKMDDPYPSTSWLRDGFGQSGMAWIGDIDGNGVDDFITGIPSSFKDSGSLQILRLGKDASPIGTPIVVSPQDPLIAPYLSKASKDQLGSAVAVIQAFSATQNTALVVTSSRALQKMWAIRLQRKDGGAAIAVTDVAMIDTSSSKVLSGFRANLFGEAMVVLDTLPSQERVVAIGVPAAKKPSGSGVFGSVLLAAIDPATLAWRRLGVIPGDWSTSSLPSAADFGRSVVRLGTNDGRVLLGVLASGEAPVGVVHIIELDASGQVVSDKPLTLSNGADTLMYPYSIAAGDFDHDGNSDLLVGLPSQVGPNRSASMGAFGVALLNAKHDITAIQLFGQGAGGFAGTGLAAEVCLGMNALAGDFDGDQQIDALVGSAGSATVTGAIWALRMKAIPWLHKQGDTIKLGNQANSVHLSDYVTGNGLSWAVSEIDPPVTGSISTCSVIRTASGPDLTCTPFTTNGYSHWKVVASDTGNIPRTDHFTQELEFVVQVAGRNLPPIRSAELPHKVVLHEDQADTTPLVLSKFFSDPEKGRLTFGLTPLNGSTSNLLVAFMTASAPYDTVHLQPIPLKHGLCSLQVTVKDDNGAIILDTLVIEVVHVNHPPVAAADGYVIVESTPETFDVRKNDQDLDVGDSMKVSIAVEPLHGKVVVRSNTLIYTPDSFYLGSDSLRYRITDEYDTSMAWVKITVAATTAAMVVYRPLRDTAVPESDDPTPPSVVVHTDSLFFSGDLRFDIAVNEATTDCQSIAKVVHDRDHSLLTITPLRYQWGRCSVSIKEKLLGKLSTTMNFTLSPVATPYRFSPDTLIMSMVPGQESVRTFDTLDLDRDTLEYATLKALPSWARFRGPALVFNPDGSSQDTKIQLTVRKKGGIATPSDTLVIFALFGVTSVSPSRKLGGAFLVESSGYLTFSGDPSAFKVELLDPSGRSLVRADAPEFGTVKIPTYSLPWLVIVRLIEGGRTTVKPLVLRH